MSGDAHPFFEAGPDAILLEQLTLAGRPSVLERLGPALFRSKGFSFIGYLQTLYDHVAEQANPAMPIKIAPAAEVVDALPVSSADAVTAALETSQSASPFDHPMGIQGREQVGGETDRK